MTEILSELKLLRKTLSSENSLILMEQSTNPEAFGSTLQLSILLEDKHTIWKFKLSINALKETSRERQFFLSYIKTLPEPLSRPSKRWIFSIFLTQL
jgi:hypothetical protein